MANLSSNTETAIANGFIIPARPEILARIQTILDSEEPSLADIADLISTDVGLSAAILKSINSPLYGMSRTISDMRQAAFLLGPDTIKMIVSGMMLRRAYPKNSAISLERFWDAATETANAMIYICRNLKDKIPVEDLYAVGLFHDCGIPAFAVKFDDYKQTLIQANTDPNLRLVELEEQKYQTNHAVIGYYISSSWGLPEDICQLILRHHDKDFLNDLTGSSDQLAFAALKAAENIVNGVRRMQTSDGWHLIENKVFDILGIDITTYTELYDEIDDILNQS